MRNPITIVRNASRRFDAYLGFDQLSPLGILVYPLKLLVLIMVAIAALSAFIIAATLLLFADLAAALIATAATENRKK